MAIKSVVYGSMRFELSYNLQNLGKTSDVLILHGWGSNKELMQTALKDYFGEFRHIYLDLPGFGGSTNDYILTTSTYQAIVELFLAELGSKPSIIVGHSFGGKVATLLNPPQLVLLSTSGILESKPRKVRFKIALAKVLKTLGLSALNTRLASKDAHKLTHVMYETFKNVVNEDFSLAFGGYKGKAYIFWGTTDTATSVESGKKIAQLIEHSEFYPIDGDHYFFLHNPNAFGEKLKGVHFDL